MSKKSRQVSLYLLREKQQQAHDGDDARAEHDPLKPSAFSRHFLDDLVWHRDGVTDRAIERVMHFVRYILRVPFLNPDGVATLGHMDRVVEPNRVALVLGDVGGVGMHLRHRHNPRRGATAQVHHDHHGDKNPEAPRTTAVGGFEGVESFHTLHCFKG